MESEPLSFSDSSLEDKNVFKKIVPAIQKIIPVAQKIITIAGAIAS